MHDTTELRVPKWPFFLADAFMFGVACFLYLQAKRPMDRWELLTCAACVGLGALLCVFPYILEYRALLKLIETSAVGTVTEKIQHLERIAAQISSATAQWDVNQQQADKTTTAARAIADHMAAEVKEFAEVMKKMNESEKATLRLEVEKLRRAEGEWLQILVRQLDHVFALFTAAERSGQAALASQIGNFQNACRDNARRIGLVPFTASKAETFDPKRHKWADGETPPTGSLVDETLATGYTFQSKLVRPALVRLQKDGAAEAVPSEEAEQNQLPLEQSS